MSNFIKPENDIELNPVDYYNIHKIDHVINIIEFYEKSIKLNENNREFNWSCNNNICSFKYENGFFFTSSVDNSNEITANKQYTPFMLLTKYKFKGNYYGAFAWVSYTFFNKPIPYIRVGINYFKKIIKPDRYNIDRVELKRWSKEEIKEDHGKPILKHITKFDDFILEPNNKDYQPIINNMYNMYYEFSHIPKQGDWKWTKILIEHVFGKQYELGLKYLQVLYLFPKQALPILVLASSERSTGKSTFLDWMSLLFGSNMVIINPADLTSQFNSSYATSNIIGVEETVTDRSSTIEKLKALSTTKFLNLNQKFIDNSKLPFFGKFIITTNDEEKFMKVDIEEIRFWVRKLEKPKYHNTKIDIDLIKEIPAFLFYLESLKIPDFSKSRMVLTPEEISTAELIKVKEASKNWLYKELNELLLDYFSKNTDDELLVTPKDLKDMFFKNDHNASINYIRTVLRKDFNMKTEIKYYMPYNGSNNISYRVFTFNRKDFINDSNSESIKQHEFLPF